MNRRKLLALFGGGGGIIFGSIYNYKFSTQPAIATNISIDNTSIPENELNYDLQLIFNKFELSTINIDPSKDITVKLNGKIKNSTDYTSLFDDTVNITSSENNFLDITNQLTNINLSKLNISNVLNTKGDTVNIEFQIRINHPDINEITQVNNITIEVVESNIPNSSGGQVSTAIINGNDYRIHAFTGVGSNEFVIDRSAKVDVLIVGGGGGGGDGRGGGGGGAGGLVILKNEDITKGQHEIIVGKGGNGSETTSLGSNSNGDPGNRGEDSSAFGAIALGGGAGGGVDSVARSITDGGSGGGNGGTDSNRGNSSGSSLQPSSPDGGFGNDGGQSSTDRDGDFGGGGGGAGSAGQDAVNDISSGDGGDGKDVSDIFGTEFGVNGVFAAGGGAYSNVDSYGVGGAGGGGDAPSGNGLENTGSGGAGGANGHGGSGIVIIRVGPL